MHNAYAALTAIHYLYLFTSNKTNTANSWRHLTSSRK